MGYDIVVKFGWVDVVVIVVGCCVFWVGLGGCLFRGLFVVCIGVEVFECWGDLGVVLGVFGCWFVGWFV